MKRRKFIKTTALASSLVLLNTYLKAMNKDQPQEITHYVLFWLKKEFKEEDIVKFAEFFEMLKTIQAVKTLKYGRAAKTNQREVVDNSFTYNLVVTFENMDAINIYENHPIHLAAIEKYSNYWEKVVVHDSMIF